MKKKFATLIAIAMIIVTYVEQKDIDTRLEMTAHTQIIFFDVGQGDSSLIITGDQAILIDAGTNSTQKEMVSMINSYGVYELDLIIATHPHEDHIGGIDYIIDGMPVGELLMVDAFYNTITYSDVIEACENNSVPIVDPSERDTYYFDSGLELEILHPPSWFESSDTNDDSIVCYVKIGETTILYTGDMEKGLEDALKSQFYDIDMLKVGHHGSSTSSTQSFINLTTPEIAVISCGNLNRYGHPSPDVISRFEELGTQIYRTDELGDIVFYFDID